MKKNVWRKNIYNKKGNIKRSMKREILKEKLIDPARFTNI